MCPQRSSLKSSSCLVLVLLPSSHWYLLRCPLFCSRYSGHGWWDLLTLTARLWFSESHLCYPWPVKKTFCWVLQHPGSAETQRGWLRPAILIRHTDISTHTLWGAEDLWELAHLESKVLICFALRSPNFPGIFPQGWLGDREQSDFSKTLKKVSSHFSLTLPLPSLKNILRGERR